MVEAYLHELTARLRGLLHEDLLGVYAGGSYALGAYERGRSDLDVTAVAEQPLDAEVKQRVVAALRHESLPCPARGLEFVLYPRATAVVGTTEPGFDLNLNTGERIPFRVDLEPGDIEGFWFAIDRSILQERGIALHGPPPDQLFAPIPRAGLLGLLRESVLWHRGESAQATAADAVLNTCRSLRYAVEGEWSSKREAGEWEIVRSGAPEVVVGALDGARLDPEGVTRFLDDALRELGA
jgi:hypothetical protein